MRKATLLSAVVVLLALTLPGTAGKVSLAASTYLCTGYAECQAAGYPHSGYRQASSATYWRMFAGHNCTNYVAYRLIQNGMPDVRPWEGGGNASNWGVEMASLTDQTPRVGAVAWYPANVAPAGSAGHVAYVEQVISDTEIIVSEDYWGGDFHWRRITRTGTGWPSGFIHFNDLTLEATTPPALSGSPAVGAPLDVAMGAWTPAPTTVTVRWLADGVAIPGATTTRYVPTPDVKGKTLTAEVTAQRSDRSPAVAVLTTAPVAPGALQATGLPVIQGTLEVGQTLTLSAAAWSPQPSKVATQWYADGAPLAGATGSTLALTRELIDARISARVTGSAAGYLKSRTSAPETTPVLAKAIKVTRPSAIKGRPQVADVLTARAGTFQPSNATPAYTWLRDGRAISKATNRRYAVRPGDAGHTLSVQITLTHPHFRATTETIAVTGPVTTTPTLRIRPDVTRRRVAVDVRVRAPGVRAPDGSITVSIGRRTLQAELVRGRARLVVRDLKPGTKPVVVRYAGTEVVQAAVSRTTIRVRPPRP